MLRFYLDAVDILLKPGRFYEKMPASKNRKDYQFFLVITAIVYSLATILFLPGNRVAFLLMYLLNALAMPVITAGILFLLLRMLRPGIYKFELLFGIAAYANVVLLLAWIPGLAPWTELLKYFLIGVGLVKAGRITGLSAFLYIASTGAILVSILNFLRHAVNLN